MAGALECWSRRTSTEEDGGVEQQVLMRTHQRSEGGEQQQQASGMQRRFQRLSRNVSEAIASLKNSLINLNLNLDRDGDGDGEGDGEPCNKSNPKAVDGGTKKVVWATVVRSLTQLYPGSQLPEKLVSNIRKHYDSMPLSYAQAGFDMKEVFVHIKLMEQACAEEHPAVLLQGQEDNEAHTKITFACCSAISWPAVSTSPALQGITFSKVQIFEKKGATLGVLLLHDKIPKSRIEAALRSASRRTTRLPNMKLPFGRLCGCQDHTAGDLGEIVPDGDAPTDDRCCRNGAELCLPVPLPSSSFLVSVDEWQTVRAGGGDVGRWLLSPDGLEFTDQVGPTSFKGVCKGKRVAIEKLKGCDKGNAYDFQLRKDLLQLMTCGHRNVLPFYGVCVDDVHGLCVVTRFMEGGSLHDLMARHKKLPTKDVMRIAVDVAEGIKFMNDHGVAYQDLNAQRILLDRHGNACLGDMGIVSACKTMGEAMEYETDGYRWLAPEIIAADPESVSETWMSNVYSFGMVVWEMVTGEAAYSAYSPVQAAVGIAACGLRPDIPKDCPQVLRSLMIKCWNSCPSKRPQFSEILSLLLRASSISNR